MTDKENLIDLGNDGQLETIIEQPIVTVTGSTNTYEEPFDPFDWVEKEVGKKSFGPVKTSDGAAIISSTLESPDLVDHVDENVTIGSMSAAAGKNHIKRANLQKHHLLKNIIHNSPAGSETMTDSNQSVTPCKSQSFIRIAATLSAENSQMLADESPLKLVENTPNLSDFEADLKLMTIPILETLPKTNNSTEKNASSSALKAINAINNRKSNDNCLDIVQMLNQLKSLIIEFIPQNKMDEIESLFESIANAATAAAAAIVNNTNQPQPQAQSTSLDSPQTLMRQATFDMDLQNGGLIPDIMISSSATYDGEPRSDQQQQQQQVNTDDIIYDVNQNQNRSEENEENVQSTINSNTTRPSVIFAVNSTTKKELPSCIVHPSPSRVNNSHPHPHPHAPINVVENQTNAIRRRSLSLSTPDKFKHIRGKLSHGQIDSKTSSSSLSPSPKESSKDKYNPAATRRRNSFSFSSTANKVSPPLLLSQQQQQQPQKTNNSSSSSSSSIQQQAARRSQQQHKFIVPSRSKTPSVNQSIVKRNEPMKAIIPIKKFIPMVKPLIVSQSTTLHNHHHHHHHQHQLTTTPSTTTTTTTTRQESKGVTPASQGKSFYTSTPMPQQRHSTDAAKDAGKYSLSGVITTPICSRTSFIRPRTENETTDNHNSSSSSVKGIKLRSPYKYNNSESVLNKKTPMKLKM